MDTPLGPRVQLPQWKKSRDTIGAIRTIAEASCAKAAAYWRGGRGPRGWSTWNRSGHGFSGLHPYSSPAFAGRAVPGPSVVGMPLVHPDLPSICLHQPHPGQFTAVDPPQRLAVYGNGGLALSQTLLGPATQGRLENIHVHAAKFVTQGGHARGPRPAEFLRLGKLGVFLAPLSMAHTDKARTAGKECRTPRSFLGSPISLRASSSLESH